MTINHRSPSGFTTTLILTALVACLPSAWAGPLDPPAGPVTSSHKTLGEIEPRIPISPANTPGDSSCTFKITQAGSYYLAGNLVGQAGVHGIKIALGPAGGHVSIDMNGFSLRGVPGSLDGIHVDASNDPLVLSYEVHNDGEIYAFAGWGINSNAGAGRISGVRVTSGGTGCLRFAGGANRTTVLERCIVRTTLGIVVLNEQGVPLKIDHTELEGDGCNATSLCYHGGPVMTGDTNVYFRNSTCSGPVIEVASTGSLTTTGASKWTASGVNAASFLHVSAGPGAFVEDRTWNDEFMACTFSTAIIDIARDGSILRGLNLRADAATTAPVGVRVAASGVSLGEAADGNATDSIGVTNSVPAAVDVVGLNNSISGWHITSGGTGVRLSGSGNSVSRCVFDKAGSDPITNIVITAGTTNSLITRNEFRSNTGGVTVSNLGGATNGIAPTVTPGNLSAATNPFSNLQH